MPTIKTKKEMNERELIKYLVDHESTNIYSSGISIDGAWLSIEPEIESKVDFQLKEVFKDGKIFTVEVEEEITINTNFDTLIEVRENSVHNHYYTSVREEKRDSTVEFHTLIDGKLVLIWDREEGLVE